MNKPEFQKSSSPSFTDHHIHLFRDGRSMQKRDIDWLLKVCELYGIKELYDMGSRDGIGFRYKEYLSESPLTLKSCGYALYRAGGYGDFIGRPINGHRQIPPVIRELYERGADFIKVIHSGVVSYNAGDYVTKGGFFREELFQIVQVAKSYGLRVHCHVNSEARIIEAIEAGVDSIEHGFFISLSALEMMKEHGVSWTPTVYALLSLADRVSPEEAAFYRDVVKGHLKMIKQAQRLGIRINTGSDAGPKGIEHGEAFLKERALLKEFTNDQFN